VSSWKVSPILVPLIAEVKAEHPGIVVGTIGDAAHQATKSDHDPDEWNFVCAADPMIGKAFTASEAEYLFQRLLALRDARIAYVIYNRRIFSRTVRPWKVRPYEGSDPHTGHVHVSVIHGSNPHPTTGWNVYPKPAQEEPVDWTNDTVQAINFFYSEAYRAAMGKATTPYPTSGTPSAQAVRDRQARNAYAFTSHADGVDPEPAVPVAHLKLAAE
jgi:hypothetical protein